MGDYRSSGPGPLRLVSECPIYCRELERRGIYAGTCATRKVTEVVITFSIRRTSCIMQPLLSRTHAYTHNKQSTMRSNFLLAVETFYRDVSGFHRPRFWFRSLRLFGSIVASNRYVFVSQQQTSRSSVHEKSKF